MQGSPQSPVRVVIFEDLQCGDCAWLSRKLSEKLLPLYAARVGFEHRDFPLPKHNWARGAAIAARYFHSLDPELGFTFRREILSELAQITVEAFPLWVRAFAKRHSRDPDRSQAALADSDIAALVEADYQAGLALSVAKTPTVFAGERVFAEWVPMEELMAVLDAVLAATGAGEAQ